MQRCDVCAPGSYQDTTGQTACIECPVGTYSEMSGANSTSTCKPAPPGNFAEGTGNDGFTPCLAGTFQDKSGQGACKVGRGEDWLGLNKHHTSNYWQRMLCCKGRLPTHRSPPAPAPLPSAGLPARQRLPHGRNQPAGMRRRLLC